MRICTHIGTQIPAGSKDNQQTRQDKMAVNTASTATDDGGFIYFIYRTGISYRRHLSELLQMHMAGADVVHAAQNSTCPRFSQPPCAFHPSIPFRGIVSERARYLLYILSVPVHSPVSHSFV